MRFHGVLPKFVAIALVRRDDRSDKMSHLPLQIGARKGKPVFA